MGQLLNFDCAFSMLVEAKNILIIFKLNNMEL